MRPPSKLEPERTFEAFHFRTIQVWGKDFAAAVCQTGADGRCCHAEPQAA
jgi:hypothetical protein